MRGFASTIACCALLALVAGQGYIEGDDYKQFDPVADFGLDPHASVWEFVATGGKLTGGYGPEPFCYDGDSSCLHDVDATATVTLDTVENTGSIVVEFDTTCYDLTNFTDVSADPVITQAPGELMCMTGSWRLEYTMFMGSDTNPFREGGVADNVVMHGTDENGPSGAPEFPQCNAFVASWGPVNMKFKASGEEEFAPLFPNNLSPDRMAAVVGHTMLTEQFYLEDKVYKNLGVLDGDDCPKTDYYEGWGELQTEEVGFGCTSETKTPSEYHVNVKATGFSADPNGAIGAFPFWMHLYFQDIEDNSEVIEDEGVNPLLLWGGIGLGVVALGALGLFAVSQTKQSAGPKNGVELKDQSV